MDSESIKSLARAVLETEAHAILNLVKSIDASFVKACEILLACQGRIVVMGMGKSGHIAGKIAATFASTGSPAFFVHPGEASHGDMGMIINKDVVLALSNSGETDELLTLLPLLKRLDAPLIALTGNASSTLASAADAHLFIQIEKEACPLQLAPTTSTTAALALGDALAISLLESRGFTADDFALSHPGGRLGKRLLLKVNDIMHSGDLVPQVLDSANLKESLAEMSKKGLGMTLVVDSENRITGIFTDGDLRRVLDHGAVDIQNIKITEVMTTNFKRAHPNMLAEETLRIMQENKINSMPVVDSNEKLVGAMNIQDLLRAGVV